MLQYNVVLYYDQTKLCFRRFCFLLLYKEHIKREKLQITGLLYGVKNTEVKIIGKCFVCFFSKTRGLQDFYSVSYLYFGAMATSSVVLVGVIVSYVTGEDIKTH